MSEENSKQNEIEDAELQAAEEREARVLIVIEQTIASVIEGYITRKDGPLPSQDSIVDVASGLAFHLTQVDTHVIDADPYYQHVFFRALSAIIGNEGPRPPETAFALPQMVAEIAIGARDATVASIQQFHAEQAKKAAQEQARDKIRSFQKGRK